MLDIHSLGDTVPSTRKCHFMSFYVIFESSSTTLIKGKQLTDEAVYNIKDHFSSALPTAGVTASTLKPNDYATFMLDGFWWLELVDSIKVEEKDKDVTCKFMHPHDPIHNFH